MNYLLYVIDFEGGGYICSKFMHLHSFASYLSNYPTIFLNFHKYDIISIMLCYDIIFVTLQYDIISMLHYYIISLYYVTV